MGKTELQFKDFIPSAKIFISQKGGEIPSKDFTKAYGAGMLDYMIKNNLIIQKKVLMVDKAKKLPSFEIMVIKLL